MFSFRAIVRATVIACSALLAFSAGCYKIDIQQGNIYDQATLSRLTPGLGKRQVVSLLGTPLLNDPFNAQRWDYIYLFYPSADADSGVRRRLTLFFEGDTLTRIDDAEADIDVVGTSPEPVGAAAVLDQ